MDNFEIAAGLTKTGSFLFLLKNHSKDELFEIREETFFYLKEELKFKDISDQKISGTYSPEFNEGLILWRSINYKFENTDQAKKKVLELMTEEMKVRGSVVSDKNSLYLELKTTKENLINFNEKINELEEKVHVLDSNLNGPKSY